MLRCNLFQLERLGLGSVVADGAKVHGRAELDRVVVGAGVSIRHPIRVTNSLIFPGTDVTAEHDVDGFIVTPEHQIDCRQLVATSAD